MLGDRRNENGEGIAEHDEEDVAYPHSCYKAKAPFVAVVQALLDDSKNNRPDRQCQSKS